MRNEPFISEFPKIQDFKEKFEYGTIEYLTPSQERLQHAKRQEDARKSIQEIVRKAENGIKLINRHTENKEAIKALAERGIGLKPVVINVQYRPNLN